MISCLASHVEEVRWDAWDIADDLRVGAEPSYLACWRRTISVIQMGANGDVQFGGVG
jgi:hypothetical protein